MKKLIILPIAIILEVLDFVIFTPIDKIETFWDKKGETITLWFWSIAFVVTVALLFLSLVLE